MNIQLLLIAKAPVPGRVKTRLCPPCTPPQAAAIADAALRDTIDVLSAAPAIGRTAVLSGQYRMPAGWCVVAQRGRGLDERLANGFHDTARARTASVLVGMDTPQLTTALLDAASEALDSADAVLGPADDGGWWCLGLRRPADARVLCGVPMSTPYTGRATADALRRHGLRVVTLPALRDVDTAEDAYAVAADRPHGRFAAAVRDHLPGAAR